MGYAKCIGRVGALAVALGVGAAVATTPAIASAAPDSGPSTTDSSADGASPSDSPSSPVAGSGSSAEEVPSGGDDTLDSDIEDGVVAGDDTDGELDADADAEVEEEEVEEEELEEVDEPEPASTPDGDDDATPVAGDATDTLVVTVADVSGQRGDSTLDDQFPDLLRLSDLVSTQADVAARSSTPAGQVVAAQAVSVASGSGDLVQAAQADPDVVVGVVSSDLISALAPVVGGSLPGEPTAPSPALWALAAAARREIGEAAQAVSGVTPIAAVQSVTAPQLTFDELLADLGKLFNDIVVLVIDVVTLQFGKLEGDILIIGQDARDILVPLFAKPSPDTPPDQFALALDPGDTSGSIAFGASNPLGPGPNPGDGLFYTVPGQGQPGGPKFGTVVVDNSTGEFTYTLDPDVLLNPDFLGYETFSYVANDQTDATGFHIHGFEALNSAFGINNTSLLGGHRSSSTVTLFIDTSGGGGFDPTDTTVTGDFRIMTYNVAGLPLGLSSATAPRDALTQEISSRMNFYADIVQVQEDFGFHTDLVSNALFPDQTAPQVPTWLWPIGVPFSDGLNTFSGFDIQRLDRQAWNTCTEDNCLTPKGFSYKQLLLPGGLRVDVYNLHSNTGGGAATEDNLDQITSYIQQNSAGNAVIVTGDFNIRYTENEAAIDEFMTDNGFTDAWVEVVFLGTLPPLVDIDDCDNLSTCEQLDKIFYRDAAGGVVDLDAVGYQNLGTTFLDVNGDPLSDHRPQQVTFTYTVDNQFTPVTVP